MIYPIKIKPTPLIDGGKHKGQPITHLKIIDGRTIEVYTKQTVIKGSPYELLPLSMRRIMGNVLKRADNMVMRDEPGEDVTYDQESGAHPLDKPEPEEVSDADQSTKERRTLEMFNQQDPEDEEQLLETPKQEKFPASLPTDHPKEVALRKKQEEHAARQGAASDKKLLGQLKKLEPKAAMAEQLMKRFDKIYMGRRILPDDMDKVLQKLHAIYVPVKKLAEDFLKLAADNPGQQQDWTAKLLRQNLDRRKDLGSLPKAKDLYDPEVGSGPTQKSPYHKVRELAQNLSGAVRSYLSSSRSIANFIGS